MSVAMPMTLRQYVKPDCFVPDLVEKSREEALGRMVHVLAERKLIRDEKAILAKLLERELIQSTAVGSGIAIPHCFPEEVTDLIISVGRSPKGIDFDSFDGKPTQVIFLLLGAKNESGLHLKALARIARLIKNTQFIDRIISATSAQEMLAAFEEEEAKI